MTERPCRSENLGSLHLELSDDRPASPSVPDAPDRPAFPGDRAVPAAAARADPALHPASDPAGCLADASVHRSGSRRSGSFPSPPRTRERTVAPAAVDPDGEQPTCRARSAKRRDRRGFVHRSSARSNESPRARAPAHSSAIGGWRWTAPRASSIAREPAWPRAACPRPRASCGWIFGAWSRSAVARPRVACGVSCHEAASSGALRA
jgi:hypothetical protein